MVGDPRVIVPGGRGGSRPERLDLRWLLVLRRLAAGAPCRPRQGEDREVPVTGAESELSVESLLDDHFGAGTKPLSLRDLPAPVRKANREVRAMTRSAVSAKTPSRSASRGRGRCASAAPSAGREACVPERDPVRLEIAVRSVQRIDPGDAHLLHQPDPALVPKARSTLPFACGEPARISSIPSSLRARAMSVSVRLLFFDCHWPKCPA